MKKRIINLILVATLLTTTFTDVVVYAEEVDNLISEDVGSEFNEEVDVTLDCDIKDFGFDIEPVETVKPSTKTKTSPVVTNINLSDYVVNEPIEKETIVVKSYGPNTYLSNVGTTRGDNQVRAIIPYTLKAGESITFKQVGGLNQMTFSAELITGLQSTEVVANLKPDGSELTLTAKDESVAYLRFGRKDFTDITVEYTITSGTTLPMYTLGESEEGKFFAEWEALGTKYALLLNDTAVLQIPTVNRDMLKTLNSRGSFNNIDHLLTYYKEMVEFFDYAYGLDGSEVYNESPPQRYLAVPELRDGTGIAGTYEASIVRAYGTGGMRSMLDDSWLAKHEFAHGYQGTMMDNDVSVREIWNNIPTHYYSMVTNSNTKYYRTNYINKTKPAQQQSMYNKSVKIRETGTGTSYSLEFFREIFDQFGLDVFIKFNQEYRRLGLTSVQDDISNSNSFAKYFSRYAGVDLIPYFLSLGFNISDDVKASTYDLPNVFYLTELVSSQATIDYILKEYDLVTKYSLVDTSIFATDENLKDVVGNLVVNIKIDNEAELVGKQVLIKNGDLEFYGAIKDGKVEFNNIPVGNYKLLLPVTNNNTYKINSDLYVLVPENGTTTVDGVYSPLSDNYMNLDYTFNLKSDANYTPFFAELTYESDNNYELILGTLADRYNPGSATDSVYAYFKVFDENGVEVEDYEFKNLTPSVQSRKTIYVKKGYTIHMYRTNKRDRRYYKNDFAGVEYRDSKNDLMVFTIDDRGLVYEKGVDNTKAILDKYISNSSVMNITTQNQYQSTYRRILIKNAINHLNDADKAKYLAESTLFTRTNNPVINNLVGKITLEVDETTDYLSYVSANDVEDGVLSDIKVDTSKVIINKAGQYDVTYYVEDSDHNYSSLVVKVDVLDKKVEIPNVDNGGDSTDNTGNTGGTDNTGNTGETDNTGNTGETDNTGNTGGTDNTGNTGETDNTGNTGETDNTGNTGGTDNTGNTGNTGGTDNTGNTGGTDNTGNTGGSNNTNNNGNISTPDNSNNSNSSYNNTDAKDDTVYVVGGNSTTGETEVTIEDRPVTKVRVYDATNKFDEVVNKNIVVPYYNDEDGNMVLAKFSTFESSKDKIVYLDLKDTPDYDYIINNKDFVDTENNWASKSIDFVTSREILNGVSETEFAPKATVTRGMIVTVLGRLSDVDTSKYENDYEDVSDDAWYANYVAWAKDNGIANGVNNTNFNPNGDLTREQLAVIIDNYLEYLGYDIKTPDQEAFVDSEGISDWALDSVYTLKAIGLVSGDNEGNFNPKSNLTRGELSSILERLVRYTIATEVTLSGK